MQNSDVEALRKEIGIACSWPYLMGMEYIWLCLAAVAAGAVNAIAGGGTLLTFPALLETFTLERVANGAQLANGTSTVALFPGSFASLIGYRDRLEGCRRWIIWLTPPSVLGGAIGVLLIEEKSFRALVPFLILTSAILFLLQPAVARWFKQPTSLHAPTGKTLAFIVAIQFVIGIYGGYFGAGIGILMLSSLSFLGLKDVHQTNALKTLLAFGINMSGAIVIVVRGFVRWDYALAMMGAAIVGGYVGARLSLKLKPIVVRSIIIVIGFGLAAYYFAKEFWL